ncbi:MmpL protein [Mycolicibacterium agri]|nr:MMPL family transporter [Mycolicibacterium agri]PEG34416.1 MmpL protein [Mycolicibacterium agri]
MVALCLGAGIFGSSLGAHVTQSGFYDDGSESAEASRLGDEHYGRDTSSHIVAIYTAPEGKTVDDPAFREKVLDNLAKVEKEHPDQILRSIGYFKTPDLLRNMADASKKHAFMSVQLKGDNDDDILKNFKEVQADLSDPGVDVQLAGLLPLANELTGTIAKDQQRAEVLALPLVAIVLFFVFGGVVAACLPVMIGGLTIAGALGIMRLTAISVPVHYFAQPVVTLIGLGIAIDYGLFIVSRFREEIAAGYDTETAVRRTVVTAGRTIAFSSVLISASVGGLLLFPQGFLKSLTYAMIASVTLAAVLSITVLPAVLGMLGRRVDALSVTTLLRIPFLREWNFSNRIITWLAEKLEKTKTAEEVENGFWGRLAERVMKRPLLFAVPLIIGLIVLILPLGNLALGGISEKYLPPTNPVRQAQEQFDRTFPGFRVEPITLVIQSTDGQPVTDADVAQMRSEAMEISGFTEPNNDPDNMWKERPYLDGASKDPSVRVIQNGLVNRLDAKAKVNELRAIPKPHHLNVLVGGTPALEQDSVRTISAKLPQMIVIALTMTTLLMFLAFGSLVLPVKAALMNALTLCSTLGVLTWIFVDGHLSSWMNFTPTPLTAPVIGLIIAVIFGLSTDYEVFLVSRMVEARARGMTTEEAIRHGTATTGRLISAAALVLVVVGGAFAFSDLVMMQYLAIGLITALLLDATVVRMFLVPSIMKLLGNDCWWAPRWMKRLQERIGLGEITLADERKATEAPPAQLDEPLAFGTVLGAPTPPPAPRDPTRPVAAAAIPAPVATGVALADRPDAEPTTPILVAGKGDNGTGGDDGGGGDGGDDGDETPPSDESVDTNGTAPESVDDETDDEPEAESTDEEVSDEAVDENAGATAEDAEATADDEESVEETAEDIDEEPVEEPVEDGQPGDEAESAADEDETPSEATEEDKPNAED